MSLNYNRIREQIRYISDMRTSYLFPEYNYFKNSLFFKNGQKLIYGAVITSLNDMNEIIYNKNDSYKTFAEIFTYHTAFLQAVYVQQDSLKRLLSIFNIDRETYIKDPNYDINRQIRNKVFGHPISVADKAISSITTLSFHSSAQEIEYAEYAKDNEFEFEEKKENISEILERHEKLLIQYTNIIIDRIKKLLKQYQKDLTAFQKKIYDLDKQSLLKETRLHLDSIFSNGAFMTKDFLIHRLTNPQKNNNVNLKEIQEKVNYYLQMTIKDLEEEINWEYTPSEITCFPPPKIIITEGNTSDPINSAFFD